jgi:hypothetical protein
MPDKKWSLLNDNGQIYVLSNTGDISDGYHTFNELYEHRMALFAVVMCGHQDISWKSKKHHDGTSFSDFFIAGMNIPTGPISYHLKIDPWWGVLNNIPSLEHAPEWDGYTSADVFNRLMNWIR